VGGRLPAVAFDTAGGAKMLRPDARASVCRTRVLGLPLGPGGSPLDGRRTLLRSIRRPTP
jgi:hypothetical protein